MAYFQTEGEITVRLASKATDYKLGEGVTVKGSPDEKTGVQELTIFSPPGWLRYEEVDGVHVVISCDGPSTEPRPEADHVLMDALMVVGAGEDAVLAGYAQTALERLQNRPLVVVTPEVDIVEVAKDLVVVKPEAKDG